MSTMKESISPLWTYECSLWTLLTLHCTVFHLFLNHRRYLQNIFYAKNFPNLTGHSFSSIYFCLVCSSFMIKRILKTFIR